LIQAPPFPLSIEGIDASFLSGALEREIHGFQSERIGEDRGMLGEIYKLTLDVDDAGPSSIVAKFASQREQSLDSAKRGGTHERELRCYDELLSLTPIATPDLYACWYDGQSAEYLILQELIDFDESIDQINGISIPEAKLVIQEIAGLHAFWWKNQALEDLPWLPRLDDNRRRTNLPTVTRLGWESLRNVLSEQELDPPSVSADALAEKIDNLLCTISDNERTLVHSDLRADNLLFSQTGDSVVIVDWQGCCTAPPVFDLTYFLIQSLTIDDRRENEEKLLDYYAQALSNRGVRLAKDVIYEIYTGSILYGLAIACAIPLINEIKVPRVRDLATSMASRSLAGLSDHGISLL